MSQQLTFTNSSESEAIANEGSFSLDDLRSSPSPRQANVSLSFSSMGSCPFDYSDDVSIVYPVSPVSKDDEDSDDNNVKYESLGSGSSSKPGHAQQAEEEKEEEITSNNVVEKEIAKESHSKEVANVSTMTHVEESL